MILSRPLSVVTPTVDGDVLRALALADASFTTGELHRLIGAHSVDGVRKVLLRLTAQGIVSAEPAGRAYLYRLNRDHLAAGPIEALARLREALVERLRAELGSWPIPAVYGALFGSAVRTDMRLGSDLDLLLVRPDQGGQRRVGRPGRPSSAFPPRAGPATTHASSSTPRLRSGTGSKATRSWRPSGMRASRWRATRRGYARRCGHARQRGDPREGLPAGGARGPPPQGAAIRRGLRGHPGPGRRGRRRRGRLRHSGGARRGRRSGRDLLRPAGPARTGRESRGRREPAWPLWTSGSPGTSTPCWG